jgi:hypothetical protein
MAFKPILELDCSTTVSLGGRNKQTGKPNPTSIEGYFVGSKQTPSKMSASGFAMLHIFQTEKGNVGLWGKTDLDRKMKSVAPGVMTRVTQAGTVPTPRGNMYKYSVEVDSDNSIEVSAPEAPEAEAYDDGEAFPSASSLDDESYDASEDEAPLDEVPPPVRAARPAKAASAPDAARQARVQALLSGNRAKS